MKMTKPAVPEKEEMAFFLEEQMHPIRKFLYRLGGWRSERFLPHHIANCPEAEFLPLHRIVEVDGPDFLLPVFVPPSSSYGFVCVSESGMTLLKEKSRDISIVLEREQVALEHVAPLQLAKFYLKIWSGSNARGLHVVEGPETFHEIVRDFCLRCDCKALRDVYDRVFDKLVPPSISGCRQKGWVLSFVHLRMYTWDENAVELVEVNINQKYHFQLERVTVLERNLFDNFMLRNAKT